MRLLKQDLLTLLVSLFILSGCDNPDSIGLDVDPSQAINGTLVDTVTVRTTTVKEDSISTSQLSKYPLGYLDDPIFGKTQSSLALSLNLGASNLTFGTNPLLDSAVLVLQYGNEYYGDVNSQLKIDVHQLSTRLTQNSNFYNTATHNFNPTIIGSKTGRISKDSVSVIDIIKGKPDVQKKLVPQIRIPINSTFINSNFLNASADNFKDNNTFNNFIKGLYVTVKSSGVTGKGGLTSIDLSSANASRLELYYKSTNGTATDTTVTTFAIQNGSSPVAATFSHDYTGTEVQTQLNNPALTYNYTFIQPLAGLRTRVNFPYLDKLKSLGNISINKAELVMTIEGGKDIFSPAPRLFFYRTDIAGQRQLTPDAATFDARSLTDGELGGFYDTAKKRYKFNVTAYIQDLLKGNLKQYDSFIAAIDSKADRSIATRAVASGSTVSSAVIGGGKSTAYKIKLNIIYTKVN